MTYFGSPSICEANQIYFMRFILFFCVALVSCNNTQETDRDSLFQLYDTTRANLGISFNPQKQLEQLNNLMPLMDSLTQVGDSLSLVGKNRLDSIRRVRNTSDGKQFQRTESIRKSKKVDLESNHLLTYRTIENEVCCFNKELMKEFVRYGVAKDRAAMTSLVDNGLCVPMKGGLEVVITDYSWGLVGFRVIGQTAEYWTMSENLSN